MNKKDNEGSVASSLFNLLSGTFFSRVTGMLREIVMAAYFGADLGLWHYYWQQSREHQAKRRSR